MIETEPRPQQAARPEAGIPRTHFEGWVIALLFAIAYGVIGYFVITDGHVVVFDSLSRLSGAYMVWWNDPPKLAAIGMNLAPLGTLAFLPLALIKPLATSLTAIPIASAVMAGVMMAMLNTLLARCGMVRPLRYLVLILFGLNPMLVYYAGNGQPEALGTLMVASASLAVISWWLLDETRYLIGAGLAMAVAVLVDYTFMVWAVGFLIAIIMVGSGRRDEPGKQRSSVLLFLTPVVYSLLVWSVLNGIILDSPFKWVTSASGQTATNLDPSVVSPGFSIGPALGHLVELTAGVAPLAFFALALLVVASFLRRDRFAIGWIVLLVLGALAVVGGALVQDEIDMVALSAGLPIAVVALAGAAWAFRAEEGWKLVVGLGTLVLLVAAIPLSWNAMRHYPYQDQAEAFTRYVQHTDSQEGTTSIGGYQVGIDPERAMAAYIDDRLDPPPNSILTDNSLTYGVILLTGRPDLFIDRADHGDGKWTTTRDDPFGKARYMLVSQSPADSLRQRYADVQQGAQPGLTPIFRTSRYVLVRVAQNAPRTGASSEPAPGQARDLPRLVTPRQPTTVRPEGPGGYSPGLGPDSGSDQLPPQSPSDRSGDGGSGGGAAAGGGAGQTSAPTVEGQ